jgi:hypothetical protein
MLVSNTYLFNGATLIPHRPFDQLSKLTESFALIFSLYYPNVHKGQSPLSFSMLKAYRQSSSESVQNIQLLGVSKLQISYTFHSCIKFSPWATEVS